MSYQIRPANRSEAKPLIGLYSESGKGKTLSALYLARGFVGPKGHIGMIETESGRGEAYADILPGGYDVISMRDNFSPRNYGEAITVAEASKLDALIIDSASHEWEGSGGVLSMAAKNQEDGKKGQVVWTVPKMDHQRYFMLRLLATPIPLVIVCMRAKYPMEEKTANGKKEWTRSTELDPKQSDDILYEMFVHGWIDSEHRFQGTKYTRDDLKPILKSGEPISIETGKRLAEWSRNTQIGGTATPTATNLPTNWQGPEHDIDPADIPMCDMCRIKLVWRPPNKKCDEPFLACTGWESHKDIKIQIPLSLLKKNIEAQKEALLEVQK